jgi:hypothetical protein
MFQSFLNQRFETKPKKYKSLNLLNPRISQIISFIAIKVNFTAKHAFNDSNFD